MSRLGGLVLTIGSIAGSLCLLGLLSGVFLGVQPVVVQSGSMSPTIPTGSLAFAQSRPAADAEVGDVVVVVDPDRGRVMHRVVATETVGGQTALRLRGDANPVADSSGYVVDELAIVRFHVPWLGRAVAWLGSPWGLLCLGAVTVPLVMSAFRRDAPTGGRRKAVAAVAAPAAAIVLTGPGAHAAFTDTSAVRSGAVQAHAVVAQAQPSCQNVDGLLVLGNIARLTWQQVNSAYEYVWEVQPQAGGAAIVSGTVGAGTASGATITLDISTGLVGVSANYSVVVRARLTGATGWTAPPTTTQVRRASILIIGTAMRCGWV